MSGPEDTNEGLDARGLIGEALDGYLDAETIRVLMKEVLASTKHARGWCGSCRKAVTVEIPDAKAVVSAMSDLLVQAKGRPSEASSDDDRVTVIYQVILQDEDGTQRVVSENGVAVGRG